MADVDFRYARALAAVAADQKLNPEDLLKQLQDFAATIASSAELREALDNPSIPEPQKLGVLDGLSARLGAAHAVRNFIAVVIRHGRLLELDEIVAAFREVADEASHVAEAQITTARPLEAGDRAVLEQQIARLAGGAQVKATYAEDPSLIGGAVVRLGSTIYDGSVRAQLEALRQRLAAA